MTVAILTLLGGIVSLWAFYAKRKKTPSAQERLDDLEKQFTDTLANVSRLNSLGKRGEADAMLRRLNASNEWLREPYKQPSDSKYPIDPKR